MISITSANIQCHVSISISKEYAQYTQVSVKKFGLMKLKGTDNNILNILSLFNFCLTPIIITIMFREVKVLREEYNTS